MSDFWNTSDGKSAATGDGNFDAGGGDYPVIPDNTNVLAVIDQASWEKDANFNEYVSLRWSVVKPDALANRKVFHKLWVKDHDPKSKDPKAKRDKALRMFAAIDANAGGKLVKMGREPDADDMALALYNKVMGVKVKVWKIDDTATGDKIEGNWVAAVMPKAETTVSDVKASDKPKSSRPAFDDLDDDIPF